MTTSTSPAKSPVRLIGHMDPELSRWLWLVKIFLAIPHLLVVGLILADLLPYPWAMASQGSSLFHPSSGYSVLNLLVVLAGLSLLINRTYPQALFKLLLGINRWLYHVLTYVALMHDDYPPFRLDRGPNEPIDTCSSSSSPMRDAQTRASIAHLTAALAPTHRKVQP